MSNLDPLPDEPPVGGSPFAEPLTGFRFQESPGSNDAAGCLWQFISWPWQLWLWLVRVTSADPTYHVPPRFGMSAIIGITTLLALLFALFRAVDLHPLFYIFTTILLFIVVLVQMRWGHMARPASIVAGAIWLPLFVLTLSVVAEGVDVMLGVCCALPVIIPIGGFLGYLAGTCAGGFFLLMELFEKYWEERMSRGSSKPVEPPATQLDDPKQHR
jgi:hypothetical protein